VDSDPSSCGDATVVSVTGNLANVPRIAPPPVPATATPTPLPPSGDVVANGVGFSPAQPRCNEAFDVQVNITNAGTANFTNGGVVQVQAQHVGTGSITATGFGNFPVLAPGQNHVVVIPVIVNQFGGQDYRILVTADVNNNIVETNEGNNGYQSAQFRLRKAGCP
jgi:subtilase family serine protease